MFLLGAYDDGQLVGIVHYLFHRSSWTPADYCYLQDLFVSEKVRGKGVGRALIKRSMTPPKKLAPAASIG